MVHSVYGIFMLPSYKTDTRDSTSQVMSHKEITTRNIVQCWGFISTEPKKTKFSKYSTAW